MRVVAIGTAFVVLAITLRPIGGVGAVHTSSNWVPLASIIALIGSSVDASVAVRNVVFNVLLFVPVGIVGSVLAAQFGRTWRYALAAGVAFSVLLETAQFVLPSRSSG